MFFDPTPTRYDLEFRLFGTPIRIHPLFWLSAVVLGWGVQNALQLVLWTAALAIAILVHELGHVAAYRFFGIRSAVMLHAFGGVTFAAGSARFNRGDSPGSRIVTAAAGPAAGFVLAAVIIALFAVLNRPYEMRLAPFAVFFPGGLLGSESLTVFLYLLVNMSLFWGAINLLPIFPLDGGQIAREVFTTVRPHDGLLLSLRLSMAAAIAMAVLGIFWLNSLLTAVFFGYMAYMSYVAMKGFGGWR